MIVLPVVSRAEIDARPISRVGLPRRAINALTHVGIVTVGQLRAHNDQQLLQLRFFGVKSLHAAHHLFQLGEQLEAGAVRYSNLEDFLRRILLPSPREVVEHRYGLRRRWTDPKGPRTTLQTLGTKKHLTRERIRQLQLLAHQQLESVVGRLFLTQLARCFVAKVNAQGGVISLGSLRAWRGQALGNYSGAGTLWLLSKYTDQFCFRYGLFTTATVSRLDATETTILDGLRGAKAPEPLEKILRRVPAADRNLAHVLLHHHPQISMTRQNEFFLPRQHGALLVEQILRASKGPLHYQRIADRYNALVMLRSRRRPGVVLRFLWASLRCEQLSRGFYRFRQS